MTRAMGHSPLAEPRAIAAGAQHAEHQAGCKMPSDQGIVQVDHNQRTMAELANERFVEALKRCIANGGAG